MNKTIFSITAIVIIAVGLTIGGVYAFKSSWFTDLSPTAEKNAPVTDTSPAAQELAESYIRTHITELSPEPAVLGGTFYVTAIRFTGPTAAVVNYEDGHIALTATAVFTVSSANRVNITSFTLVPQGANEAL